MGKTFICMAVFCLSISCVPQVPSSDLKIPKFDDNKMPDLDPRIQREIQESVKKIDLLLGNCKERGQEPRIPKDVESIILEGVEVFQETLHVSCFQTRSIGKQVIQNLNWHLDLKRPADLGSSVTHVEISNVRTCYKKRMSTVSHRLVDYPISSASSDFKNNIATNSGEVRVYLNTHNFFSDEVVIENGLNLLEFKYFKGTSELAVKQVALTVGIQRIVFPGIREVTTSSYKKGCEGTSFEH